MATICGIEHRTGDLFAGIKMSRAMYAALLSLVIEKYGEHLQKFERKHMREAVALSDGICFRQKRGAPEATMLVVGIEGLRVDVSLSFNLYAVGSKPEIQSLLHYIRDKFLPNSGLEVKDGVFIGTVFLTAVPFKIPTPHNGAIYFLDTEEEKIEALNYMRGVAYFR